jgi:hypothetical protein
MNKMVTLCSAAVVCATGAFANSNPNNNNMMPTRNSSGNSCPCLEQGLGLPKEKRCFPAAYSAPAAISVSCGWNANLYVSFLYWEAMEGGLEAAYVLPSTTLATHGAVAEPDFTYKPGFKIGVGFDTHYDDWTGWLEYTYFHQEVDNSFFAPALLSGTAGNWQENTWFATRSPGTEGAAGAPVETEWTMNLDVLDWMFSRPYYQGTQLAVSPYAGLRALFIRQEFEINLNTVAGSTAFSKNRSHAWSIGPVTGVIGRWFIGKGFRFEGKAAGSLLYTQYTKISHKEFTPNTTTPVLATTDDVNALRPVAEIGAGMGWGTYLYSQQFFLDFSARYDFMYLWSQNVMRNFASNLSGFGDDVGDLGVHGLTLTGTFNF